jgi:nucleoside-diphosphate-sugar epimerase
MKPDTLAFVTGGSGFLGRHLIAELVARGVSVRALARSEASISVVRTAGAEPTRGDLDDVQALTEGMKGCDVVFHAAANAKVKGDASVFMRTNVVGTKNVLSAARGARVRRLVHVGTEAVLAGGAPIVRADETWPYPAHLAGPYPLSKALAERAVIAANGKALETVVVRPRLIWGSGDTSVLPDIVLAVKQRRFAWISGGRYLTSTSHVRNVVEGALLAAEKGTPGEVYFVTDGEPVEFRAFVTEMLATQGVDAGDREIPRWLAKVVARATWWMKNPPVTRSEIALAGGEVTVDDGKARRDLGYRGTMTRDAGLAEMRALGKDSTG